MRKIIGSAFVSLDGVMQAPGGRRVRGERSSDTSRLKQLSGMDEVSNKRRVEHAKIIGFAFVSLDGVMQAAGGPTDDPTGGFKYGGWMQPLDDEASGNKVGDLFNRSFDLLLGRRTYDIFAAFWPIMPRAPRSRLARYSTGYASMSSRAARSR